jgi:hypothetical protein
MEGDDDVTDEAYFPIRKKSEGAVVSFQLTILGQRWASTLM